jgi:tRNA pseudouridine38-40 synthase
MENSPSPQEPDTKKLKMSTTTTSDDENRETTAAGAAIDAKPRYKRHKIAIFFAYCGVGYQGMQKNPGAKTIEGDLEEALFFSGAIPDQDRGHPKRLDWARSARTDKGVSAVGQVVSGRFFIDPPGLIERLNSNLPSQFRIFGFKRVTPSFSAKKFCDRRRYVYLIPVFALDPACHRDRESVLASMGSESELVKCLECSERGRKVPGVMGKSCFQSDISSNSLAALNDCPVLSSELVECDVKTVDEASGEGSGVSVCSYISSNGCAVPNECPVLISEMVTEECKVECDMKIAENPSKESELVIEECKVEGDMKTLDEASGKSFGVSVCSDILSNSCVGPNECPVLSSEMVTEDCKVECDMKIGENPSKETGFCYGEKEKERFNRILKNYEGTHNYYNFTSRIKAEDPAAIRYVISVQANTTVTVDGIEFVKCEIIGQSFMLHQIRKMIGLAVAIMRNCAPETFIETALKKGVSITVPTAPEVGLYLDECFFTSYNKKWEDTHEEVSMESYADAAEDFKLKHIYTHIASTEHKEGAVAVWLHSLNYRNYPDLRFVEKKETNEPESVAKAQLAAAEE